MLYTYIVYNITGLTACFVLQGWYVSEFMKSLLVVSEEKAN